MKYFKFLWGSPLVYLLIIVSSFHFTACSKTVTDHDTTIIIDTVYDLTDGLVAYYNFNNGNLNDSSGMGNNIAFNNATKTADRFGNPNNAYLFDGSSSYMTVPNSPSLNPDGITLYAIIKVNGFYSGTCSINFILSKGYPADINGFYDLGYDDFANACTTPNFNNESFAGTFGDNSPQGTAASAGSDTAHIVTGTWYYLVYTHDGTMAKMYVNGELKDSEAKSITFNSNSYDLWIGRHENPPFPYYVNGVIDEIRIYNRALGVGAIKQLINLKD
jgi:hypothetical protein